ncbi:hypothetical protein CDAR_528001 [Caerostris darwini]|uniref:Uncharacterized protein n=1 Tax=Caerostris darwini TaxID=1538125 RepID=A0AAV4QQY9_9ARAC|nr:hypothetical protein CDAR_528001 [Caerostris darwini]
MLYILRHHYAKDIQNGTHYLSVNDQTSRNSSVACPTSNVLLKTLAFKSHRCSPPHGSSEKIKVRLPQKPSCINRLHVLLPNYRISVSLKPSYVPLLNHQTGPKVLKREKTTP